MRLIAARSANQHKSVVLLGERGNHICSVLKPRIAIAIHEAEVVCTLVPGGSGMLGQQTTKGVEKGRNSNRASSPLLSICNATLRHS